MTKEKRIDELLVLHSPVPRGPCMCELQCISFAAMMFVAVVCVRGGEVEISPVAGQTATQKITPDVETRIRTYMQALENEKSDFIYFGEETEELLQQNPDLSGRLISDLIQRQFDKRPAYAMHLAGELATFSLSNSVQFLCQGLQGSNITQLLPALRVIGASDKPIRQMLSAGQRAQLLALLDHPNVEVRKSAIQACGMQEFPEARAKFMNMMANGDRADPARVVFWLGRNFPDREVIKTILSMEQNQRLQGDTYWIMSACECFLTSRDAEVVRMTKEWLVSFVRGKPAASRYDQAVLRVVKSAKLGEVIAPFLLETIEKARDPVARGYAIEALAECRGPACAGLLLEKLGMPEHRESVIKGLGFIVTPGNRALVWKKLAANYAAMPKGFVLRRYDLELLLANFPEESRSYVEEQGLRLGGLTRMWLVWRLNQFKLADVLAEFHTSGILPSPPTAEQMREVAKQAAEYGELEDSDKLLMALEVLGVAATFDAEADEVPCPYDRLIRKELAGATYGRFAPTDIRQTWHVADKEAEAGTYTVEFTLGNNHYRFSPEDYRDWFDVPALLKGVNVALSHEGKPERFISLATGGQDVALLFCDPKRLSPLVKKYSLPLDGNADQAIKSGQDFERTAKEALQTRN